MVLLWVSSIGKSNLVSFISKFIFILLFSLTVSASISSSICSFSSFSFSSFSCLFNEVEIILLKSFPKIFISFANVFANLSPKIFFLPFSFSKYLDIVTDSLLVVSVEISEISLISLNCFFNIKLPLSVFSNLSFNFSFLLFSSIIAKIYAVSSLLFEYIPK